MGIVKHDQSAARKKGNMKRMHHKEKPHAKSATRKKGNMNATRKE